jgi:hypothetical protein
MGQLQEKKRELKMVLNSQGGRGEGLQEVMEEYVL